MANIQMALPVEAGCLIDGRWGHYGPARMVLIATCYGYSDENAPPTQRGEKPSEIIDLARRNVPVGITWHDQCSLDDATLDIVEWLNSKVAPAGYRFDWLEGEFFLQTDEWWTQAHGEST